MSEAKGQTRAPAPSVRHARQDRTAWWGGLLLSVILHALAFFLFRGDAIRAEEPPAGERPAAVVAGGGALRSVRVRLPERREIPPPPEPIPSIDVPEVEVRDLEVEVVGSDELPVAHAAALPGLGGGPGRGDGGDAGTGNDYLAPVPRSILPHWDPPQAVRGMEVTVRVFVDEGGRPSGLVELHPPTPDESFNREIRERIRGMEYRPALRSGVPVAGWAEITFIF
ncbi:MAG: energy transducer TonB [Gemmatimonadota bacterium]|nr:energy transducer TonB [Gemmatimonadota bacterium]